jgi:ATP-binding cassette subfamily C protein CydD
MVNAARADIFKTLSDAGAGWLGGADAGTRTAQIIDRTAKLEGYASRWLPGMRPRLCRAGDHSDRCGDSDLAVRRPSAGIRHGVARLHLADRQRNRGPGQGATGCSGPAFRSIPVPRRPIRPDTGIPWNPARERKPRRSFSPAARSHDGHPARGLPVHCRPGILRIRLHCAGRRLYRIQAVGRFPFGTGETLTLAEGLTALILAPEFFSPIRKLSSLHHDRADATAAAETLSDWLERREDDPVKKLAPLPQAPVIVFDGVVLGWGDDRLAVSDLSFEAEPGKVTTLAGPSGSGKSTALLALIGRARLVSGQIRVGAHTLAPGESLADSIAYIGQTPWLMEGTIRKTLPSPGRTPARLRSRKRRLRRVFWTSLTKAVADWSKRLPVLARGCPAASASGLPLPALYCAMRRSS